MKKVFLYAYDRQNLGDDLFVHTITKRYPHVKFYMWTGRENKETYRCLPNLKVVDSDSGFARFLRRLRPSLIARYRSWLENRCAAVVYIGGSIFYEYEHGEGIPMWWEYMAQNRPLYVLGANFGPYRTEAYRARMASIFARMKDICFRDRYSAELFREVPTVRRAPDILFSYPMPRVQPRDKQLFVSVIDCTAKSEGETSLAAFEESYVSGMARMLRQYLDRGWRIVFASFCREEGDCRAIGRICREMDIPEDDERITTLEYDGTNADALTQALAASEYVIASRFHGAILALAAGRPVFPVIYSDKTARVLEDIGFPGSWADLREPESICFNRSTANLGCGKDPQDLAMAAQAHFAELDRRLGRK